MNMTHRKCGIRSLFTFDDIIYVAVSCHVISFDVSHDETNIHMEV